MRLGTDVLVGSPHRNYLGSPSSLQPSEQTYNQHERFMGRFAWSPARLPAVGHTDAAVMPTGFNSNNNNIQPIRFHDGVFFLEPLITLTGDTSPTLWGATSKIYSSPTPDCPQPHYVKTPSPGVEVHALIVRQTWVQQKRRPKKEI